MREVVNPITQSTAAAIAVSNLETPKFEASKSPLYHSAGQQSDTPKKKKDNKKAPDTIGFGVIQSFGAHVFRVDIEASRNQPVTIVEHYGYQGGVSGIPLEEKRVTLPRSTWTAIADAARRDFNERLKARKLKTGRWKTGENLVDRLLGKELCVLAWAAETAHSEELPIICGRWGGLRPEERWWLFSITVAEAGLPEDSDRGWRKALYYALSDGNADLSRRRRLRPENDNDLTQLPIFGAIDDDN